MTWGFSFRPELFPWYPESTWEGEANRSSPDYIRWVQSSLNRVMGLRLVVDGVIGPATRSAVRGFQQRQGLAVDGIVGPNTEAALIAAGAPQPPAAVSATGGGSPVNIPPQCSLAGNKNCHVLYFGLDKDTPTPPDPNKPTPTDQDAHEEKLFEIAERVIYSWETPQPVNSLLILGHASPEGTDEYNYDLAMRRAQNVIDALAKQMNALEPGSGSRITLQVESCGEKMIAGVSAEKQRRVEVCFPPLPRWFETGGTPPIQPVWAGNDVQYFIEGKKAFEEMVRIIRTARSTGHYIYLVGWWLSDDFELVPGDPDSQILKPRLMNSLFRKASTDGVQIRAMLWDQWDPGSPNAEVVDHINDWISLGAAILDNKVLASSRTIDHKIGSHHQKVLIVNGSEGLVGFCGGIDINPDRIGTTGSTPGEPFHDVHCRIKGPAAYELLKIFLERWKDHPDSAGRDAAKGPLLGWRDDPRTQTLPPAPAGKVYVQIGRTYGNGTRHPGIPGGYSFAPNGEQTARRMILKAIREARRFIYIEDQYLVSMEISRALVQALPNIQHLTILIPHGSITDMQNPFLGEDGEQVHFRRQQFIAPLRRASRSKVGVFFLSPPGAPGTYVHSKMMVVDDEYAIIGSANLNRRSLTHDSEAVAGIYDPSPDSLVKRLRVNLWAKHLNMITPTNRAKLADGVASVKYWSLTPPPGTHVAPYDENQDVETRLPDWEWDEIDPDGS